MKVLPISSKMLFKDFGPRANERVPEGAKFFAKAILTFWAPTLLLCYVIGEALPFYLVLSSDALGILLGILIYNQPSDGLLSCVPIDSSPDVPSIVHTRRTEKAA